MPLDLRECAQRQLEDYDKHQPGILFADDALQLTIEQAYELQGYVAALREKRREAVAGYKVGCVSEAVRRQLGLSYPVLGRIFACELHESGCALDESRYAGLAIEGEFAVRIGGDGAVRSVFPVIELHNYVFRGSGQPARELIANNAIHAGVILPPKGPPLVGLEDLRHERIAVCINDEVRGTADGAGLLETIASSLQFVKERLSSLGLGLKPGHIVLTGSPLPLYRVKAGDRISVQCSRFPDVTAAIEK
jgi:2-keto-4-pentenoate hydratase